MVAGPGTGKTEVITRRIAWLIATKRARPQQILGLTFTDRAATEMQERVDLLVPYGQADSSILTFHAFGDRVLREFGHELGLPDAPRVIGRADQVVLLREHLFELGLQRYLPLGDPTRFLGSLADLFGRAKDAGVTPADLAAYAAELGAGAQAALAVAPDAATQAAARTLVDEAAGQAELAVAYARYQALLAERGLLDLGDQVSLATRLLRERPAVAGVLTERFRYVLVDEAQDIDPVQLELIQLLAAHRELTLVGDDDQAIYTFRGAAVEGLMRAERRAGHAPYRAADQPPVARAHPGGRAAAHPPQRPVPAGDPARAGQAVAGPATSPPAPAGPGGRVPHGRRGGGRHRGRDRGAHRGRRASRGLRGPGAHERGRGSRPAQPGRAGCPLADRRGQPAGGRAGGAGPAGIPAGGRATRSRRRTCMPSRRARRTGWVART